jgi:hypothetical protein
MKIIINNVSFDYNTGCRLLKLKYDECPDTIDLQDIWEDIVPMTFKEIATTLKNIEQRRVAIQCLGLERLTNEVEPVLINTRSIKKTAAWVNQEGELVTNKFTDTYELYKVKGEMINQGIEGNRWEKLNDVHFVKCKDTSTDRNYFIWVDAQSVYQVNSDRRLVSSNEDFGSMINAVQAIAWTIQTNVPTENIEKIVRQGDCIMIKKKFPTDSIGDKLRHLTEVEYLSLLVAES